MWFAEEALREGYAVRIVTRTEARRTQIEGVGAECWIGDPNRLGTLRGALEGVAIACWLLGSATGTEEQLRALHGARLRAFLESAIDTTVRGFLCEVAGPSESPGWSAPGGSSTPGSSVPGGSLAPGGLAMPGGWSMPGGSSVPGGSSMPGEWSMPTGSPMLGESPVLAEASVPATALVEGERIAREITQRNSIPLALLRADPADVSRWVESAHAALASMLA